MIGICFFDAGAGRQGEGIALMVGVHGAEEVGGRFVMRLLLPRAPCHEEAVARAPEHPHPAQGLRPAHPADVLLVPQNGLGCTKGSTRTTG